ncbi:MAG: amidohydrolase, partial [Planctomycetes bacterium]|nr:amidohydrolase [Planctomycetota bacterium]
NWGNNASRFPKTRSGVELSLRRAFEEARRYADERDAYTAAKAAGDDPDPPRRDLRLEALAGILSGDIDVHSHCYRAHEILMLIRIAEDFGFKVATFQHVLEGYKVAREIGAHGGRGCSTFIDWWGFKFEAYDAIPYNPALVYEAGVPMSINSDSSDHIRRLYLEAAKAVRYGGVPEQDALAMVTRVPAMQLGLA